MGLDLRTTGIEAAGDMDIVTAPIVYNGQEAWISAWIDFELVEESEYKAINFELGRWYRLKAVAHDDTFEFYVDGRLIASLGNAQLPAGRLGLFVMACEAQFDNVIITGDDVPDNTDLLVDGDLLATVYWFEEAWRIHSVGLSISLMTDDYVYDNPPYPI